MSLLSATQGRPERVRALFNLVDACGRRLSRTDAQAWMAPELRGQASASGDYKTALGQVIQAARDLELVAGVQELEAVARGPLTATQFSDYVHEHLCRLPLEDKDAVLLAACAAAIVHSETERKLSWISGSREAADRIDALLVQFMPRTDVEQEKGTKVFNPTKMTTWRYWMVCLGLGWHRGNSFILSASARLARILPRFLDNERRDADIEATYLLREMAASIPYLDGGSLFEHAVRATGRPRQAGLSIVLSNALRELHDDGFIELKLYGDTSRSVELAPDDYHGLKRFTHVSLRGGGS